MNTNHTNLTTSLPDSDPFSRRDPSWYWRRLCLVAGTRIVLSGDLPNSEVARVAMLDQMVAAGIGHIVDVRIERNDAAVVRRTHPELAYHWLGVDDDGNGQADEWFEEGVAAALRALVETDDAILVHCHMGVNRGPSMGFAILLATGMDPVEALTAIRAARPIAAVLYAEDALRWWHRASRTPADEAARQRAAVAEWFAANPIDAGWVISRIWQADGE